MWWETMEGVAIVKLAIFYATKWMYFYSTGN